MDLKYPNVSCVFDYRSRSSETRPGEVSVLVANGRNRRYFSTGVKVMRQQWHPDRHVVNHPDAFFLNIKIEAVRKPIVEALAGMMLRGTPFSFDELRALMNVRKHDGSFLKFLDKRIDERADISETTRRDHRTLFNTLRQFGKIDRFSDLTERAVRDFDAWLRLRGIAQTTIGKYHKNLRCYVNEAMSLDMLDRSPYRHFKVDKGKSRARRFLTETELGLVRAARFADPAVERARDLFVFQCFTGLAYADLVRFDFSKVEERGGRYVLRDIRQKTGEDYYVVLLTPAMEILRKYDCRLPLMPNQKYNVCLKSVGVVINRSLTSHMGRHTAATMMLNKGMPLELVARVLGHTNIKQTMLYAKIVDSTLERAFDAVDALLR